MDINVKGFEKETNIVYKDEVVSFIRDDGCEDYTVEIVTPKNDENIFLIIPYVRCERAGIWLWHKDSKLSLENFVNIIVDSVMPKD